MTRPIRILIVAFACWDGFTSHWSLVTGHWLAEADIPRTIHYQGKLEEADGSPVFGEHTVTMRLYDAPTGGAKLWEERHDLNFTVEDKGAISLDLGSNTPFAGKVTFTDPVWLSIEVDATGELVPRQALTSSGYALNADRLDGLSSTQVLRADIDTLAKGRLELTRPGLSLLVKPTPNPVANTRLVDVQDASGSSRFNVDLEGDVSIGGSLAVGGSISSSTSGIGTISEVVAGDGLIGGGTSGSVTMNVGAGTGLTASADAIAVDVGTAAGKIVQLDGTGALPAVSGSNLTGLNASNLSSGTVPDARLSAGVSLLGPTIESAELTDTTVVAADTSDTFLTAGSGATVTKTPASWQVSATGTAGNRVTQSASNTLAISTVGDTTLLSATITKSQAGSILLVLATVQLLHTGGPGNKTVDVKIFRDATQLDANYTVRLGTADRAVSDVPVSVHAVDTSGTGTYTVTLRATSSGSGAQATTRRLTVIELL